MESPWIEPLRGRGGSRPSSEAVKRTQHALAEAAGLGALRAAEALLAHQKPDGFWCSELLADTTLESDFILLQLWLHPPRDGIWRPPSLERVQKASRSILDRQLHDGGFNIYPGGPADLNASVKAYDALKLSGVDPAREPLRLARQRVLELGGLQGINSYTRINLS